jgi:hypothetical protein
VGVGELEGAFGTALDFLQDDDPQLFVPGAELRETASSPRGSIKMP